MPAKNAAYIIVATTIHTGWHESAPEEGIGRILPGQANLFIPTTTVGSPQQRRQGGKGGWLDSKLLKMRGLLKSFPGLFDLSITPCPTTLRIVSASAPR